MKHAPTRSPESTTSLPPAMRTPDGVSTRGKPSPAALSGLSRQLPPATHQAEEQSSPSAAALGLLISASCYLSLSQEGTTGPLLEAAKLCHDLASTLALDRNPGNTTREDLEETLWLTKQNKWERHYCLETAIRFVLSPQSERERSARRKPRSTWTWLSRLRRPRAVPPF